MICTEKFSTFRAAALSLEILLVTLLTAQDAQSQDKLNFLSIKTRERDDVHNAKLIFIS